METITLLKTAPKTRRTPKAMPFTYTVTKREAATLSEFRMARPRWFETVGDHVTACYRVTVSITGVMSGMSNEVEYFEIVTAHGRGVLFLGKGDYSEMDCWIPSNGGQALAYGCFKKYGKYRGCCVAYLLAMGFNVDSRKKVDHCCVLRLYYAAQGKSFLPVYGPEVKTLHLWAVLLTVEARDRFISGLIEAGFQVSALADNTRLSENGPVSTLVALRLIKDIPSGEARAITLTSAKEVIEKLDLDHHGIVVTDVTQGGSTWAGSNITEPEEVKEEGPTTALERIVSENNGI